MKAATRTTYGPPDVLELSEVERPVPADSEVLVRVRAVSVNPADWYILNGPLMARISSGLRAPKTNLLGTDYAGTVEAVAAGVTRFRVGDEVFGGRTGAFAEYVCVPHDRGIALKPANMSFEEAAALPIAAITALQGLRDKARLRAGHDEGGAVGHGWGQGLAAEPGAAVPGRHRDPGYLGSDGRHRRCANRRADGHDPGLGSRERRRPR